MLKDYTMTPNRAGIPVWRPAQPVIGKEEAHQTALTNWARMMRTQYPALTLYHHIPNGGLRDKRTAARLIGQGVHSGVPDVFVPAARGGYHGIYVELKTGANSPTPNQNEFMSGAMAEGYYCAVCYGWPCAAAVIEDYLHMGAIPAADVAPAVELEDLRAKYQALVAEKAKNSGDTAETYTTGYRYGHRNGQIELLQQILGIFDGVSEPEETNE